MNEPRPGKKLLVLDIDYTLFGNYVTCKTSYSYIILYHIYLLLIHFNEHLICLNVVVFCCFLFVRLVVFLFLFICLFTLSIPLIMKVIFPYVWQIYILVYWINKMLFDVHLFVNILSNCSFTNVRISFN